MENKKISLSSHYFLVFHCHDSLTFMKASSKNNELEHLSPADLMTKVQLALAKHGFSLCSYLRK